MREHDVTWMTYGELQRTRRELAANLALVRPGSPARVPIEAHMSAVDAELAEHATLTARQMTGEPLPRVTLSERELRD